MLNEVDQGRTSGEWLMTKADAFPALLRPTCKVVLVSGPPGAGKSRYVREHAEQCDLVIDLDEIEAELSGEPIYRADRARWLAPALNERNRLLRSLANMSPSAKAFVVVCAPGQAFGWWRRALCPLQVISLVPPQWQAEENIKGDPRRSHDVDGHLAACADWYARDSAALHAAVTRARRADTWDSRWERGG